MSFGFSAYAIGKYMATSESSFVRAFGEIVRAKEGMDASNEAFVDSLVVNMIGATVTSDMINEMQAVKDSKSQELGVPTDQLTPEQIVDGMRVNGYFSGVVDA